jgi:hypothetical protein
MKQHMKKIIFFLALLFMAACSHKKNIPETLQNKLDMQVISNNFYAPAINLEENHLKEILVLLHNNFTSESIKEHFSMSDSVYNLCINDLFGEGLIKKTAEGKFVPTCMMIDIEKGNQLKKTADSLGREMSLIAIDRLTKIKEAYSKISAFKNISFDDASLFILGNVIHNYWQMPVIEEKFLKAEAPHRGANRYYLAILENNSGAESQPFGLFANSFQQIGNYTAGYYGNKTAERDSIITKTGLREIVKNKNSSFPLISSGDQKKLNYLALIISPDLLNYLEKNRTLFVKLYLNSIYKDQTTFREWFVWYYQFIITQTNKTLIEKGYIKNSSPQTFRFILLAGSKKLSFVKI